MLMTVARNGTLRTKIVHWNSISPSVTDALREIEASTHTVPHVIPSHLLHSTGIGNHEHVIITVC